MRRRAAGFTLVELMIAIVLTAIIFTLGFGALRLATEGWGRTDRLVTRASDLRTVGELLRREVAQMVPEQADDETRAISFVGAAQELAFIAPAPSQSGRLAGLYRYRFHFAATADGSALVLDYRPYEPGVAPGWEGEHETAMLLPAVAEGSFAYYGRREPDQDPEWLAHWDDPARLPERVRLALQPAGAAPWPELEFPVWVGGGG